jgi:hypothetical protein
MRPPPSTTAAIGTGSLVRRTAVVAANITVDHDATEVAKGTVARFHGSSAIRDDREDLESWLVQEPATCEPREQDGRTLGRVRCQAG